MTAPVPYATHLRRIADAVARAIANEREACAELCENNTVVTTAHRGKTLMPDHSKECGAVHEGMIYAAAIRARATP